MTRSARASLRGPTCGLVAIVALTVSARLAAAQTTAAPPMPTLVAAGDRVSITTADGVIHQGRIVSLTTTALELQLAQGKRQETVSFDRLRRVDLRYHDGLADGLKLGLVAGLVSGAVVGIVSVIADCHDRAGEQACTAADGFGGLGIFSGLGAAAGALIGTVADAQHLSVREVWRTPRASPISIAWAPIAMPRRVGFRFALRW